MINVKKTQKTILAQKNEACFIFSPKIILYVFRS